MSDTHNSYYIAKYPIESFWSTKKGVRFDLIEKHVTDFSSGSWVIKTKKVWYKGDDEDFKTRCVLVSKEMDGAMKMHQERESLRRYAWEEQQRLERNERKRLLDLCECKRMK